MFVFAISGPGFSEKQWDARAVHLVFNKNTLIMFASCSSVTIGGTEPPSTDHACFFRGMTGLVSFLLLAAGPCASGNAASSRFKFSCPKMSRLPLRRVSTVLSNCPFLLLPCLQVIIIFFFTRNQLQSWALQSFDERGPRRRNRAWDKAILAETRFRDSAKLCPHTRVK